MRLIIRDVFGDNFSFAEFFKKKTFWLIVGLIFLIVFLVSVSLKAVDNNRNIILPKSFLDARFSAALVSRRIAELTSGTSKQIEGINIYDLKGKGFQALALVKEAKENNEITYKEAVQLSNSLEQMAISLSDLPPGKSQRKAYEAVAIELSLVSEFIRYTQNLNDFLEKLDRAISLNNESVRKDVYDALSKVNKSTDEINKLNSRFVAKMKEFDDSL